MASCQTVTSKDPLEYCGNEPAEEYDLEFEHEGEIVTGSAYFCEEHEPPECDKA